MRWVGALLLSTAIPAFSQEGPCADCHPAETRAFRQTGMGRSIAVPSPDDALGEFRRDARLPGPAGATYISANRGGRIYHEEVRDGAVVESLPVLYGIGSGEHGRSYAVGRGGGLFESPLSYYTARGAWDLSPGYAAGPFRGFTRPVSAACLFCHSGAPQPVAIGCERCHGSGEHAQFVNPAKLAPGPREDVCYQCHLGGDIRILRAGKTELDFRPGGRLGDTVAVFSLPPSAKPDGLDAVGQPAQLRMSRCWKASQGKLGCLSCHDPHAERTDYRSRCLQCHASRPCVAAAATRRATSPPDNCVMCHMPRSPLNRVAHIAHTNHRILRFAEEALDPSPPSGPMELTCETQPEPDLRSKALAYATAAQGLPVFGDRARALLAQAGREYPEDKEITAALAALGR